MQVRESAMATGIMLSNTSIICPIVEDNLGKLRLILDRGFLLKGFIP